MSRYDRRACKSGRTPASYYNETGLYRTLAGSETDLYRPVRPLLKTRMGRKTTIPRIEEQVKVRKRSAVTRVRVRKTVLNRRQTLDIPLRRDQAVVRRVPVNRVVKGPVAVRQEGTVTIVPVLEEVPVVTTQLVLKEELHIEMRTSRVAARREVVLRSENVKVTRDSELERPRSE